MMRTRFGSCLTFVALLSFGVLPALGEQAAPLKWRWAKEKANLQHSISTHLPDYDLDWIDDADSVRVHSLRIKKDGALIFELKNAHAHSVFARRLDTLFLADYCPHSSGCDVIALDLKSGKTLWKTTLQGIGPADHSKYLNLVNIDTDQSRVIINGNEVHGRYVEHLDIKTGKTIANKKFKADTKSLLR